MYPQRVHSTCSARLWAAVILVVATAASVRAETGYDAWLRYAPLPAPIVARVGSVPRSVTLLGDSPVLRSARDELTRGLSSMLSTPITTNTALPRTSTILLGTLERIRPLVPGAPAAADLDRRRLLAGDGNRTRPDDVHRRWSERTRRAVWRIRAAAAHRPRRRRLTTE